MKNIRHDSDDALRPEYTRSDFSEMVKGKYALSQLEFADLVRLLIACIGEDEGLRIAHHSIGNTQAAHRCGEWTYEIDNANQITLRYWVNEFRSLEEPLSNPAVVTSAQERSDLQDLLVRHVQLLKTRVGAL